MLRKNSQGVEHAPLFRFRRLLQLMHVREEWTPAVGRVKIPASSKVGLFTPCPSLVGLW
jgi:hypothetical protein